MSEGNRTTILVVDDIPGQRLAIEAALAELGEHIVAVGSGSEALRFLLESDAAVILLDVNMPDMDGYAVCRALRHVEKFVPIVFISAKSDVKDFVTGREAGADSYLVKPITRAHLRSVVNLFTNIERKRPAESPKQ
jgi:CheY-like chemotaxis protein